MPPPPRPQGSAGAAVDRGGERPVERGDRAVDRQDRDERQRAAAAEAERLAREHSNKREQKARQDRARGDDSRNNLPGRPPRSDGRAEGGPLVAPGSSVARPLTPAPTRARSDGARDGGGGRSEPGRSEPGRSEPGRSDPGRSEPGRSDPGRSAPPRAEAQHSVTAVERPVADRPDDRPRVSVVSGVVDRVGGRADAAPRVQSGFEPPPSAGAALIDDVAVEAEELLREAGGVWARWSVADRISATAAVLTFCGTFLPWLSRKNADVELGIGSGGVIHAVVAVLAVVLLIRREAVAVDERGARLTRDRVRQRGRRTALWLLLLSLVSTVSGTWLLLVWGAVRRFEVPDLQIGAGLYLTLAAGLGLSYSGFAFFWRR